MSCALDIQVDGIIAVEALCLVSCALCLVPWSWDLGIFSEYVMCLISSVLDRVCVCMNSLFLMQFQPQHLTVIDGIFEEMNKERAQLFEKLSRLHLSVEEVIAQLCT